MIIGITREILDQENRVGLTPAGVNELIQAGHRVLIEKDAGFGSGFSNEEYYNRGAEIIDDVEYIWNTVDMIVKVKEPLESEYKYLREGLVIFTYFHLAANEELVDVLLEKGVVAIGYETVELENGSLPLLNPMSEVAGRMAIQRGSLLLENIRGGKGVLIDGVPGVAPGHIVIVGAGIVGVGAIRRATGLGARVTILDIDLDKLKYLSEVFMGRIETVYSNNYNLEQVIKTADLLIGAVLIPGGRTPKLITKKMVKSMEEGSVIIDVGIDQGGCVETITKPTSHSNPTFIKYGVVHYAVPNIPSSVAGTSTSALTNATIRYVLDLANKGWKTAAKDNKAILKGVNIAKGKIIHPAVAKSFNRECVDFYDII